MHAIQHREKTNTYSCYPGPEPQRRTKERKRVKRTLRAIEFQRAVSSFSTSNDEPPSSSSSPSLPAFPRPVERVQVEAKVKPEESSPAYEGSGSGIGIHFKVDTSRVGPFSLLVKGWRGGSAVRPRRNTGCVFRCAITMAVCILITRHRARLLLSSILRETLARG